LPAPSSPVARSPRPVVAYVLEGRLSVRQGEQRHHAGIAWRHEPGLDEILITNPLGQGVAELSRNADGARLVLADRREYRATDWETLSGQVFGFELPLSGLPRWITGQAGAAADGWQVDYVEYQNDEASALPTLIELRRGDIELRLKVDEWQDLQ
jgi:outer membrane lipoprotein LolB